MMRKGKRRRSMLGYQQSLIPTGEGILGIGVRRCGRELWKIL